MQVITLGTGSSLPTLRRGLSATALIREGEITLFDCGEGTQLQFQRAGLKPGKLKRICISHLHGDHFFGVVGFLTSLQMMGRNTPLSIYGPTGLGEYIEFVKHLTNFSPDYPLYVQEVKERINEVLWDEGEFTIEARPLDHGIFILGFSFTEKPRPGKFDVQKAEELEIPSGPLRGRLQKGETVKLPDGRSVHPTQIMGPPRPGKKAAYCVDTRPCSNSVELARGADLLIHDGTFSGEEIERARETGHSTVAQAAEIAQEAKVGRLILTHISARYDETDEAGLLQECRRIFPRSWIAQDLMAIQV